MKAEFNYSYGSVRIEVDGMPAGGGGLVVKRGLPNGPNDQGPWNLELLRGFDNTTSWPGAGLTSGIAQDFEMPLGIVVHYVLVPKSVISAQASDAYQKTSIETPGNMAWLRDPRSPVLSQPVWVVSTDPKNRPARQSVFKVAGKKESVVVWDAREARQGTITLFVKNQTADLYRQTRRDKMDKLLDSGRPLLFSMCASKGFDNCWMAVQDVTYTRWGSGPAWTCELAYLEVDNPIIPDIVLPPPVTYTVTKDMPVTAATYDQWNLPNATTGHFASYFDLVEGELTFP